MTLVKVNNNISRSIDGMMKELFSDFPNTVVKNFKEDGLHFPPVNITQKPNGYLLELAAPGLEKTDFNLKLDNNLLTISADRKTAAAEENSQLIRKEFDQRSFKRSFTLDEKIDRENITAKYENGILRLELPKKEIFKPAAKEINIS
jgi:HSP20 family protein